MQAVGQHQTISCSSLRSPTQASISTAAKKPIFTPRPAFKITGLSTSVKIQSTYFGIPETAVIALGRYTALVNRLVRSPDLNRSWRSIEFSLDSPNWCEPAPTIAPMVGNLSDVAKREFCITHTHELAEN